MVATFIIAFVVFLMDFSMSEIMNFIYGFLRHS